MTVRYAQAHNSQANTNSSRIPLACQLLVGNFGLGIWVLKFQKNDVCKRYQDIHRAE